MHDINRKTVVRVGVQAIVNRDDEFLFVLRARGYGAGQWCFPGGHLEVGETIAECALRELAEETSITGLAAELVAVTDPNMRANYHMQIGIKIASWTGSPVVVNQQECLEVKFAHPIEIEPSIFLPTQDLLARLSNRIVYPVMNRQVGIT